MALCLTPSGRLYDSSIGRFLNRDPLFPSSGYNPYAYAANDPAGRVDPTGMADQPDPKIVALIQERDRLVQERPGLERKLSGAPSAVMAGHYSMLLDALTARLREIDSMLSVYATKDVVTEAGFVAGMNLDKAAKVGLDCSNRFAEAIRNITDRMSSGRVRFENQPYIAETGPKYTDFRLIAFNQEPNLPQQWFKTLDPQSPGDWALLASLASTLIHEGTHVGQLKRGAGMKEQEAYENQEAALNDLVGCYERAFGACKTSRQYENGLRTLQDGLNDVRRQLESIRGGGGVLIR